MVDSLGMETPETAGNGGIGEAGAQAVHDEETPGATWSSEEWQSAPRETHSCQPLRSFWKSVRWHKCSPRNTKEVTLLVESQEYCSSIDNFHLGFEA